MSSSNTHHGSQRWLGAFALLLLACSPPAEPVSPKLQGLRVETHDPPAGARLVGPIEGSDGPDCALLESRGTEARALAALQKAATERGVDYVKVSAVTKPYIDHSCVHKQYRIEGIGYALSARPAKPPEPACTPACGAGYVCLAGSCAAQCDPACGPAQYCRSDRVCAPLAPTTPPVVPAPLPPP